MPDPVRAATTGRTLWTIIAIGFGVMFLSSSIKGAYQVYFRDLADLFELGRGQFALTGALFGLVIGIVSPLVGAVCDRFGPGNTIFSGALAGGLSFLLLGTIVSYPVFLIAYGVFAAYALAAMTFIPMGLWIDQAFRHQHKGLAFAAISNGVAIGFMVLSPVWVWFNGWLEWRLLALGLGVTFLLAIAIPLWWAGKRLGGTPDVHSQRPPQNPGSPGRNLRQPVFLVLAISFAGCGSSMAFIDLHYVPLMQEQQDAEHISAAGPLGFCGGNRIAATGDTAGAPPAADPDPGRIGPTGASAPSLFSPVALALSLLGAFELIGALVVGFLAARTQPALLLALLYGLRALILVVLALNQSAAGFLLFASVFGVTYMGTVILTSLLCLQCYGPESKGKMFGLLFSIHQIAVFLTGWLGGLARDLTGSYTTTTLAVAAVCLLALLAAAALHPVLREQNPRATAPPQPRSRATTLPVGPATSRPYPATRGTSHAADQ